MFEQLTNNQSENDRQFTTSFQNGALLKILEELNVECKVYGPESKRCIQVDVFKSVYSSRVYRFGPHTSSLDSRLFY